MIILGIETSCDETAVSIVEAQGDLESLSFKVLGSAINSQIDIHKEYGGVFPALAKRAHIQNLPIVYGEALNKSGIKESEIEIIFVTVGPGLEPALWTGINFAEDLGKKLNKPVVPANHMLGHTVSVLFNGKKIEFPAIALLVSGGHTELVLLKDWKNIEKLGETQDDAVGEAFDKVARMLGLPYPGGPEISRLAARARNLQSSPSTDGLDFQLPKFPRPMIHSKDYNFSFSGLKTAVLYYIKKIAPDGNLSDMQKMEIAREFEDAAIETLLHKTKTAIREHLPKTLIVGGGVIANKKLREDLLKLNETYPDLEILIPDKDLTTDNATMIAAAGYIDHLNLPAQAGGSGARELRAKGNLDLS